MEEVKQKNTEKVTESGIEKRKRNLKPAWKKGDPSPNPKGHPKGQRNYATLRAEAIIAIGKQNGKTPEEIEIMLHSKGLAEALKGDFRFYKDDLDRTHGSATQKVEIHGDIENTLNEEQLSKIASRILNGNTKK